jgi:very-short-patch-repair endonuclease
MAAQVWAGPECRVSHRSAARLMNLSGFRDELLEITTTRRLRHPDVIVHHLPRLDGYDMTIKEPFLITTAARTILDLGGVVGIQKVEDALEDAVRRKLTTLSALHWELEKQGGRGHPGSKILGKLLKVRPRTYPPTESPLEVRIDRVLRAAVLPPYVRQIVVKTRVGARRPDFAFPEYKVAVEGDSYNHHSGRKAWMYDKQRDRALRALGWDLIYVTWDDLRHRKDEFIRDLSATLACRGWRQRR